MDPRTSIPTAKCPHCRRTLELYEARSREGAIFACSWIECGRQVMHLRGELVLPRALLRDLLGRIADKDRPKVT